MNPVAAALILIGSTLSVVSGLGLLRLQTAYARIHAAGKASPISFLLIAAGCGIELGIAAAAQLAVAALALVTTLPVATHLLFRAVHRTTGSGPTDVLSQPTDPISQDDTNQPGQVHDDRETP